MQILDYVRGKKVTAYRQRYFMFTLKIRVPRWRSWLRHRATNWQVAVSIPDGVSGFFSLA
jgi:hypothetical protein